jgi:ribokinase
MTNKVLNFGSLNLDYVYQVEHILQPGETLSSNGMQMFCGGKGLNQSVALAKAGILPYHAGVVGEDGNILINFLKKNRVDANYIEQTAGKSGHTIIQVDNHALNCILVHSGTNRCQTRSHIDTVLNNFCAGDYLMLQNEINELGYIIDKAYSKGMKIILNPSPFDDYLKQCDMKKISIFIMNEVEGEALTGCSEPQEIIKIMQTNYPEAEVLLTLGDKGAYYAKNNDICFQEIYPVKAVDTTAAGDTFTGYFVAGLIEKLPIKVNMQRSAKAASIAVSREGAAQSIPALEEVLKG